MDFQGPNKTFKEMIDWLKSEYNLNVSMVFHGTKTVYANYDEKFNAVLEKKIEDVYLAENNLEKIYEGKKYLIYSISATVGDADDEASTPYLRYIL